MTYVGAPLGITMKNYLTEEDIRKAIMTIFKSLQEQRELCNLILLDSRTKVTNLIIDALKVTLKAKHEKSRMET